MNNLKNDKYYALQIIENINKILFYVSNKTIDEFLSDNELMDAVMFRFVQLIENIKRVSEEIKIKNPDIPWEKIIGFRNRIVHEYGKTDYSVVYETATQDLNQLLKIFIDIANG